MHSPICTDSSVLIKVVLVEEHTREARALWSSWTADEVAVIGPEMLLIESCSVVRKHVHQGRIRESAGTLAIEALTHLKLSLVRPDDLYQHAWQLACRLRQPTLYDCYYLAVAESFECEFWTADRALYRACHATLPWVRLLGE